MYFLCRKVVSILINDYYIIFLNWKLINSKTININLSLSLNAQNSVEKCPIYCNEILKIIFLLCKFGKQLYCYDRFLSQKTTQTHWKILFPLGLIPLCITHCSGGNLEGRYISLPGKFINLLDIFHVNKPSRDQKKNYIIFNLFTFLYLEVCKIECFSTLNVNFLHYSFFRVL